MWNLLTRIKPKLIKNLFDSNKIFVLAQLRNIGNEAPKNSQSFRSRSTLYYVAGIGVLTVGMSYAAVPLYRMFCAAYSYGGTTGVGHDGSKVESMQRVADRIIKIKFNADIGASMRFVKFKVEIICYLNLFSGFPGGTSSRNNMKFESRLARPLSLSTRQQTQPTGPSSASAHTT